MPCNECVSSVLYTCVFALLPAQCTVCKSCIMFALLPAQYAMCVSPLLGLHYCQRSVLCVLVLHCVYTTASVVCCMRTTISTLLCLLNVLQAQFAMQGLQ